MTVVGSCLRWSAMPAMLVLLLLLMQTATVSAQGATSAEMTAAMSPNANMKKALQKKRERKQAFRTKSRDIIAPKADLSDKIAKKIENHKRLNLRERKEVAKAESAAFKKKREEGVDLVSNTAEAARLRAYKLRKRKKRGILKKKEATLAQILFPGVSPEDYNDFEQVWIYADQVWSPKDPVPFDVYDMPWYKEVEEPEIVKKKRLKRNLGSRLLGHEMKPAPFKLATKIDSKCTVMGKASISQKKSKWLKNLIHRDYMVHLELDTLPLLYKSKNFALRGYPVGFRNGGKNPNRVRPADIDYFLYNHMKFTITYHEDPSQFQGLRITGFDVKPVSIKHKGDGEDCKGRDIQPQGMDTALKLTGEKAFKVVFSYDVKWVKNDLRWADRWDVYLIGAPDDIVHYYSVVNSIALVLFMTLVVAMIMIRALRNDISGYNELQLLGEEDDDDTGWKLVHGDALRPPSFSPMALSILVGTGTQIGLSGGLALVLSIFKITNVMRKGQMLSSLIFMYFLTGSVAGYISSRIYSFSDGKAWKMNIILTATMLPGLCVMVFIFLNFFLSYVHAASAVSFWTILYIFFLWVCVATPMVFVGGFMGVQAKPIKPSARPNNIARIIPSSVFSTMPVLMALFGGVLPFGSVCVELSYIMSALWLHQVYYVMGFVLAVGIILVMICAEVSIVMAYMQLCAEDHRWWWKAFWNCASAGIYLFLYSLWFLASQLHIVGTLPVTVYLTYMLIISGGFGLFCGSAGFLSSFWFIQKIYGSIKVE